MDELDQPLHDVMNRLSCEYADAEILVNITSGTPQMQMLLSQMVLELRYHARGIQVKTPEKKAGTTVRTNTGESPDISLYDHSKVTAAVGACISEYLLDRGETDYFTALVQQEQSFRLQQAFLLYSADFPASRGLSTACPPGMR